MREVPVAGSGFTICLWFDTQGEEAARFYASVFKDSKIGRISRYTDAGPGPAARFKPWSSS